jgi:SAM-dependent methyltransferase
MSEVTTGLRAVLSLAGFYEFVQNSLGARHYRCEIAKTYVRSSMPGPLRVLDVGCGTAQILEHLPACTYVGIDFSDRYIEAAKRRYGDRATFLLTEATAAPFDRWRGNVDCILMLGLLHHLDDADSVSLFRAAGPALAPDGVVIAVDPTVSPDTHPLGRFLAARDRGRNVRAPAAYAALASQAFHEVKLHVRHDLLRVPYSHAILECSQPLANGSSPGGD